jgi:general stress protein 26
MTDKAMIEGRPDAIEFLKTQKTGVLATLSPDGNPRARLVYYASDDAFAIYFITLANTRKAEDITKHSAAAFVVANENVPQTVQIEGKITDVTESAIVDPILVHLFENLKSNSVYFAPLTRFDPGDLRFFKLTPTWIRWGDFTSGIGTDELFSEIPAA